MKFTAPETAEQRQLKVKALPRFQRTKETGTVKGIGGFTAGDIPALQRGTEALVAKVHKGMQSVKKRYQAGDYEAIMDIASKMPKQLELQVSYILLTLT